MTQRLTRVLGTLMGLAALTTAPLLSQTSQVDNTGYGGTSGEFLLLGAGARGAALGDAFSALTRDVTSLYYNAAGLAEMPHAEAQVSTYSYIASTHYTWVGLGLPFPGGTRAIGFSLGSFGFSNQPVYTLEDPDGNGQTYSVSETFMGATYAQNFSDRFSAGITAKLISDKLGSTNASAFAVDFGTNFHAMIGDRPIRAAFTISNLGTSLKASGSALDVTVTRAPPLGTVDIPQNPQPASLKSSAWSLPVQFLVGVSFDALNSGMNRVSVLGEFSQPINTKPGAGLGLEYQATNISSSGFSLALRGSYTLQPDNNFDVGNGAGFTSQYSASSFTSDGLAAGGGLAYTHGQLMLGFDYAYKNYGPLGATNYLSFSVGW